MNEVNLHWRLVATKGVFTTCMEVELKQGVLLPINHHRATSIVVCLDGVTVIENVQC